MNKTELAQAILDASHRPDLSSFTDTFIRRAEGMIRRDIRAYPLAVTLVEADRVANGLYNLPDGFLEARRVRIGDNALESVSLAILRVLSGSADPFWYAVLGDTIEFRGIPGTNATIDLDYLGSPPVLSVGADTNALLTEHESLYVEGALFHLYRHTQDRELAADAFNAFSDVMEPLNQQFGRRVGGASVAGAYNLYGNGGGF